MLKAIVDAVLGPVLRAAKLNQRDDPQLTEIEARRPRWEVQRPTDRPPPRIFRIHRPQE